MSKKSERRKLIKQQNANKKITLATTLLSDRVLPVGNRQEIRAERGKLRTAISKAEEQLEAATA